ncbi:SIMPL domain-containing protein [Flavobacteriaceae bacterium M23B6Z8]
MKKIIVLVLSFITMNINAQQNSTNPTVSVTGEGIVKVIPDEALIKVSVEHTGKEAAVVKEKNDQAIDQVFNFCKSLKIEPKHIQTDRINLNKNYDYQLKKYNYVANQSITIKLKDLDKYETLMQGLLNSGINRIDNVIFASSKRKSLETEARKKAMLDAKTKAIEYATAVGQEIGKALYISETGGNLQPPQPMYRTAMSLESSNAVAARETVAPGELEIRTKVYVVFQLK